MCGFVEPVHALDLGDNIRVQALGAAVTAAAGDFTLHAAGNPAGGTFEALQVGDHLFDRAAGGGLDDQKVDQQNAEQGGDDQQQTADDISQHAQFSCVSISVGVPLNAASFAGSTHQVNNPRS